MLTVGSLFSGVGGLELGLERAGMKVLWQIEIEPYARQVLARHWPDVTRYGDVRDVTSANVAHVDVLCGGFPCQDVSLAGSRLGMDGKRSTLWSEFARLIGEIGPRWVVAENVPGVRSANDGRFFGTILGDLAALGFDAEWDGIPAAAVGAPHLRDRVFIVAYPAGDLRRASGNARPEVPYWSGSLLADADKHGRKPRWPECQRQQRSTPFVGDGDAIPDADSSGCEQQRRPISVFARHPAPERSDWWSVEPDICRVAHGVPSRVDRLRCLGNAVVPAVAQWVGRRIVEAEANND